MKTTFLSHSDCIVASYYPYGSEILVFKSKSHIEAYSQNCKSSVTWQRTITKRIIPLYPWEQYYNGYTQRKRTEHAMTAFNWPYSIKSETRNTKVVYHLQNLSKHSGQRKNGTRPFRPIQWKMSNTKQVNIFLFFCWEGSQPVDCVVSSS